MNKQQKTTRKIISLYKVLRGIINLPCLSNDVIFHAIAELGFATPCMVGVHMNRECAPFGILPLCCEFHKRPHGIKVPHHYDSSAPLVTFIVERNEGHNNIPDHFHSICFFYGHATNPHVFANLFVDPPKQEYTRHHNCWSSNTKNECC